MRNRYETRPVWWATLIVGVFLCGFAYWGVTATLQPIVSDALRQSQNDPPWEMLGAVVTAIGALLAVGIETKDKEMPLGVAPQGICAGAIVVLGLLLTYAKAEHDRREHEAQEAKLNRDGALLLETSKSAAQLLAQMKSITASMTQVDAKLQASGKAIEDSVTTVQEALGKTEDDGLRGQVAKMTKAALTADAIAAQVTPKIAANIRDGAAPLIAAQFIVPSGAEIAGKIKLPTASDIAGKISVPSANEIARAALEQQPVEMRALAKALVDQGFKPPTPNDLFQALRESKNLPSREELADALAKSLVNDAIPSVQSGFGDRLIKALRSSHVACETIVVALKNAIDSAEERQRLATLLQGS